MFRLFYFSIQEGFTNEISFQNHICHEEERPHVCTVCSKRFQMVQQLRRHTRAAHARHTEEPQVRHEMIDIYVQTTYKVLVVDPQVFSM